jgi:hypothetical protein
MTAFIAEKKKKDIHTGKKINDFKNLKTATSSSSLMRYLPGFINYAYADIKFLKDKMQGFKNLKKLFYERVGYELNLQEPRSFNEKIVWKKIHDRNPLLTQTADKYAVRSFVRSILGAELANEILIPLYHVGSVPEKIPFNELPEKFVIKPNHGSGMHMIVEGKRTEREQFIIESCKTWLKSNYGLYHYEWAYRKIQRKILVEQLLQTQKGELPMDIKLHCFHGKCRFIRLSLNRFGEADYSVYLDTLWNVLPVVNPGYPLMKKVIDKPLDLNHIIHLAEKLSSPFDAVRVDMYLCDEKIFFGELTHYEASGLSRFEPPAFDFEMGSHWNIDLVYRLKK